MTVWDPFKMQRRSMFDLVDGDFGLDWDDTQLDMYEEEDKFVVKVKAPGFDSKNVDISIESNSVTITGKSEVSEEEENKEKKYYKREIRTQSFTRTVNLPRKVESEKVNASFKHGILTIELPKAQEELPKKITIKPE